MLPHKLGIRFARRHRLPSLQETPIRRLIKDLPERRHVQYVLVPTQPRPQEVSDVDADKYYTEHHFSDAVVACYEGFDMLDLPQAVTRYRAKPLEGVWATAPCRSAHRR